MKKILGLLSAITLTASTVSYVVACPKKEVEEGEGEENSDTNKLPEVPDYNLTLTDYLKEVNDIINDEVKSASETWFQEVKDDSSFSFIKPDVIKSLKGINLDGTSTSLKTIFESPENNGKKERFVSDIKSLVNFQNINDKVIKLKDDTKYSILLSSINENELITLDEQALLSYDSGIIKFSETDQITPTNIAEENKPKDSFINIDTKFGFTLKYYENDENKTVKEDKSFKDFGFNFTSTSNNALTELINKKTKELKYSFIGDVNFNTLLKNENTNNNDDDKFIINDQDTIKEMIKNKFKGNNFKKAIVEKIKEGTNILNNNVKIEFENDDSENSFVDLTDRKLNSNGEIWDYSLSATTESKFKWKDNDDYTTIDGLAKNEKLYNYIFKKIDNEKVLEKYDESVYNYVKDNYKNWLADYYAHITDNNEAKASEGLKKSTSLGLFNIKGLKLKINNFSVDLSEFYIAAGYQVSDEEITSSDLNENSVIFKSIVANLTKGIKAYQDTFGIENTTDDYKIAAFNGGDINGKNLWDSFDQNYISGLYSGNNKGVAMMYWASVLRRMSNVLSLDISNRKDNGLEVQDAARKVLLNKGNQTVYNWQFIKETLVSFILKNDINGDPNTNGFYMDAIYYSGDDTSDIRFKLNFIDVTFTTDRIWKKYGTVTEMYKNRSIIENTRKK
ncbi:hypothetical protein SGLAD_v1c04450 [Spiroplasma gladiatoris]|uniref:Lipoprotein n=1 Tax=Spiroplasma gladiatoris TaxID=2143 RepID=A0A4P7AGU7_9MOLU|nr:lipoprotein [Spiroplasma gladiatoris]QBQ07644.1 hypothetical protein SGLAD_v1c04450 [Spiroplasma gladiatoris]